MFRRLLSAVLTVLLLLMILPCAVNASGSAPQFRFELDVNGDFETRAEPGDKVTVSLYLHRTDSQESYAMYGMQAELRYDTTFFRLIEDSKVLAHGIMSQNVAGVDQFHEVYMNFLSTTGKDKWEAKKFIGSFQLEVISDTGVSEITNEDFLVSFPDGSDSYACESNENLVIVTTDCAVTFESNGGSEVPAQTVIFGEKIQQPEDPVRQGKVFVGWFQDIQLTKEWDFETDTVKGNMTLYAKWADPSNDPTQPTEDETQPKPGDDEEEKQSCIICGRETHLIFGIPLCWLCLLILIVVLLTLVLMVRRMARKKKRKSEN